MIILSGLQATFKCFQDRDYPWERRQPIYRLRAFLGPAGEVRLDQNREEPGRGTEEDGAGGLPRGRWFTIIKTGYFWLKRGTFYRGCGPEIA